MDTTFPENFVWGAATSAYQIEGSPLADGAGASIWHRFAHTPGKMADSSHGDIACDHYRRFEDDVRLMRDLGLRAYRFSISWSRVLPEGVGRVNQAGLDFYSRLVDTLLEHGIEPFATLYHWDLPAALEDRGGWAASESADWFAEYARLLYRALDGRVTKWATLNEPWVTMHCGYVDGNHAPGRRDWSEAARVSQNLLRAHASAVNAYRAEGQHSIGLVVNLVPIHPADDSMDDLRAAERFDAYLNRQFLDPAILGQTPTAMADIWGPANATWRDGELKKMSPPIDFVGINYYLRLAVCDDPSAGPPRAGIVQQADRPHTSMDWEIFPAGLVETLAWVRERYGELPLYITENGAAFDDQVSANGAVDDPQRVQYLREHLLAARQAIDAGVNLRGYFAWSLLDNFEWACGYSKRFGIVHVDFATQERVPKSSALFYADVIRTNGAALKG
jgi:beta-glucosidase